MKHRKELLLLLKYILYIILSHLFINFFNQKEGGIQIEMRKILKNLFTDQSDSGLLVGIFSNSKGKVMCSQACVCPQSASWLLVHCLALLRRDWYASYWNAFLFVRHIGPHLNLNTTFSKGRKRKTKISRINFLLEFYFR